jgi:paired radical SAM protein 2
MITTQAKLNNFQYERLIVKISYLRLQLNPKIKTAFVKKGKDFLFGHSIVIKSGRCEDNIKIPQVYDVDDKFLSILKDGDIILIEKNGTVSLIWSKELNPEDTTLFITNQCNANCVMCPQPPKKDDFSYLALNSAILDFLKKEPIKFIGITGGEPTLKKDEIITLLSKVRTHFPAASIDLLTNAKKLSDFHLAKELALSNGNITFCVSFPADNPEDFDRIMGAHNYHYVIQAIQNLAKLRQRIELRIVIMQQNYKRLPQIVEFIYRNFPFVYHIAFMGMEITGHAYNNYQKVAVDPKEYSPFLEEAIIYLRQRDMYFSIYNIPFCLVEQKFWNFLCNSISSWKQIFKEECNLCLKKKECAGLFSTTKLGSYNVKPIRS